MLKRLLLSILLSLAAPVLAQPPELNLQRSVEAELAKAPLGTRFGLLVVDDAGTVLIAVNPDQRFVPASNTKLFTTAAAYALLSGMDKPDTEAGAQVFLVQGKRKAVPDVVLYGRGDARMSSAPDCVIDCLAALADAIAAKTRLVGNVTGDDTQFVDQRWSPGMSWNNFGSNDAAAASALSLDSNELTVRVLPGADGTPPTITASGYVTIINEALTVAPAAPAISGETLVLEHRPNSREFRLYGTLPANAGEWRERIGIDDPAQFAAWNLVKMLRARGVKVTGRIKTAHLLPAISAEEPGAHGAAFAALGDPLASLTPAPLSQDVVLINQLSQNHHAELLLRRIGADAGAGSLANGLAAERALLEQAGIPRSGYDFFDGSGMSTYNRVSPRAAVALLRWIAAQPWGPAWTASLPVAGVNGTLRRRFVGTALAGNLTAKTGTLNATSALSGSFRAVSGRHLTFAFFANDVPDGASAVVTMEAVLVLIAGTN